MRGPAPASSAAERIERIPRRHDGFQVPRPVAGAPGLLMVDATWGTIAPIELGGGVRTVGELEVIDHIAAGLPIIDTRLEHFFVRGTIPTARNIPHDEILDAAGSLDPGQQIVFFCNGPQCAATPDATAALIASGYPADAILYYRGGLHDWMTLGLPVEAPA